MLEDFRKTLTKDEIEILDKVIEITGYNESSIYDEENLKIRFLMENFNKINNNSLYSYYSTLVVYSNVERLKEKDIYSFTASDFKTAILLQTYPSLIAVQKDISVLRSYIDFAIKEGYLKTNINILKMSFRRMEIEQLVNADSFSRNFVNEKEIIALTGILTDPQDKLLYLLSFYIPAYQDDLIEIKRKDIDFKRNTIQLTYENSGIRVIKEVPQYVIDLIKVAFERDSYLASYSGAINVPLDSKIVAYSWF